MSQKHTETSPIKSEKPRAAKMELSFSIERILAIDSKPQSKDVHCGSQELAAAKENPVDSLVDLPWLSYTRYSPPKLPSKYSARLTLLYQNFNFIFNSFADQIFE